jgi:hypothetical protein
MLRILLVEVDLQSRNNKLTLAHLIEYFIISSLMFDAND